MKNTKNINLRDVDSDTIDLIDREAERQNLSRSGLVRLILSDYANRVRRSEASTVLKSDIDDLIAAQRELQMTINNYTVTMQRALEGEF